MDQKMGMVVLAIICGIILLVLLLRKRAQIILNFSSDSPWSHHDSSGQ